MFKKKRRESRILRSRRIFGSLWRDVQHIRYEQMTLGRKVDLYTKYGKKKWRFYEIDGFKMGDFQI